jgi:hypothetical protein
MVVVMHSIFTRPSALLVAGVMTIVACAEQTYIAPIDSYARTDDPRVLIVSVRTGVGDAVLSHSFLEDESGVTVSVRVREDTRAKEAIALQTKVTITLASPLGTRALIDPGGERPQRARHSVPER